MLSERAAGTINKALVSTFAFVPIAASCVSIVVGATALANEDCTANNVGGLALSPWMIISGGITLVVWIAFILVGIFSSKSVHDIDRANRKAGQFAKLQLESEDEVAELAAEEEASRARIKVANVMGLWLVFWLISCMCVFAAYITKSQESCNQTPAYICSVVVFGAYTVATAAAILKAMPIDHLYLLNAHAKFSVPSEPYSFAARHVGAPAAGFPQPLSNLLARK